MISDLVYLEYDYLKNIDSLRMGTFVPLKRTWQDTFP